MLSVLNVVDEGESFLNLFDPDRVPDGVDAAAGAGGDPQDERDPRQGGGGHQVEAGNGEDV